MTKDRIIKSLLVVFALLVLSACGGGDEKSSDGNPLTVNQTGNPVTESTGEASPPVAGEEGAAATPSSGSGAGDGGAETPPSDEPPPLETPPGETPPGETPVEETPPAEQPPAEGTPPAETPPTETPAAEGTPPEETAPAETPSEAQHSVNISWIPPTANTDNSGLVDLVGFYIYSKTGAEDFKRVATVNTPGVADFVLDNLAAGEYTFAVSAYNAAGVESDLATSQPVIVPKP